ncbi:hypothetical protein MA16_Dca007381 [Dendrobium catenatum]|uniref:Uncharacterized protein n=1 Tax=Dendrobium catenatum TaxID=906689 RepID=A0A2I0W8M8_9ASPA|nr:hypothetical protein MA16_Dca007381 [Dendrobium catenatum]
MTDPEVDHGFILDAHGGIHIVRSPFFDFGFGFDDTVEDYLNRILPHLVDILDDQFLDYEWTINGHPLVSPTPASSPATSPLGITCVIVQKRRAEIPMRHRIPEISHASDCRRIPEILHEILRAALIYDQILHIQPTFASLPVFPATVPRSNDHMRR